MSAKSYERECQEFLRNSIAITPLAVVPELEASLPSEQQLRLSPPPYRRAAHILDVQKD